MSKAIGRKCHKIFVESHGLFCTLLCFSTESKNHNEKRTNEEKNKYIYLQQQNEKKNKKKIETKKNEIDSLHDSLSGLRCRRANGNPNAHHTISDNFSFF